MATSRIVLWERVEFERACGAEEALDAFCEFEESDFFRVAKIDWLAFVAEHEAAESVYEVVDVTKTSGLGAVAEDSEGAAVEGLREEGGDYAAVVEFHAGAVGIEDSGDVGTEAEFAMVGHGDGFSKTFRFVVATSGADWVYVAPVGFFLRVFERVAVALAGGGEEETGVEEACDFEHVAGGGGAGFEGLEGEVEIVFGAG